MFIYHHRFGIQRKENCPKSWKWIIKWIMNKFILSGCKISFFSFEFLKFRCCIINRLNNWNFFFSWKKQQQRQRLNYTQTHSVMLNSFKIMDDHECFTHIHTHTHRLWLLNHNFFSLLLFLEHHHECKYANSIVQVQCLWSKRTKNTHTHKVCIHYHVER